MEDLGVLGLRTMEVGRGRLRCPGLEDVATEFSFHSVSLSVSLPLFFSLLLLRLDMGQHCFS